MCSVWRKAHVLSDQKTQRENVLLFFTTLPPYHKAHEEAKAVYYTVIKHFGHLKTLAKRRKHYCCGSCLLHFPRVLKCPSCFITV